MEWAAPVADVAHLILADINLHLTLIGNDPVFMQYRNVDPVFLLEVVAQVFNGRIEQSVPVNVVDFG